MCFELCDGLNSKYDVYQLDYRYPHRVKTFIRNSIDNEMVVVGLGTPIWLDVIEWNPNRGVRWDECRWDRMEWDRGYFGNMAEHGMNPGVMGMIGWDVSVW